MSLARQASDALVAAGVARATCLLGSVARCTERPDSDVDLLVVTPRRAYQSDLLRALPDRRRDERLSLIPRTEDGWLSAVERGSLFVLHARLEGAILHDGSGWLGRSFQQAARVPPDVPGELRRQRRRLRALRDVDRFNGRFLFALSDLFSIGKASAIAHCVGHGEPVFVKQAALSRMRDLRPDLAAAADLVATLQPFYDHARGRQTTLPFPHDGETARVSAAIRAVDQLTRG